jgi:dihydrolipoamide dehydrogenase
MTRSFDAIVIGAGPAGEVAAGALSDHGLTTAIVERELVGGECSYYACMPSKTLLRPGALAAETRRVPGVTDASVETIAALRRRDEVIHDLDDAAQLPWLEQRNVTLVRGAARLDGERRVVVTRSDGASEALEARRAVIVATGSGPVIPALPGLRELTPWTNREITTARQVPPRLLILGGGVVGVEMAQAWASFGAQVTVVELGPRLVPQEEPFASAAVADGLRAAGVELLLDTRATAARFDEQERVAVLTAVAGAREAGASDGPGEAGARDGARETGVGGGPREGGGGDGARELRAEVLLCATGRAARTEGLGLDTVGVAVQDGEPLAVDERLRVGGRDWLYAIGDVNGRALLTHEGKLQARIAANLIAGRPAPRLRDYGAPPRVIFTDTQVAAIGPTLEDAQAAGIDAVAVDARIDATGGASWYGKGVEQRARFVVDQARGVLVGATFTGPDVAELLHAASIAVAGEVPLARVCEVAPAFPTRSEVWLQLIAWAERET